MRWYLILRIMLRSWYTALMSAIGRKLERTEGSLFLYRSTTFACIIVTVGAISPERRPLMRSRRTRLTEIGANLSSSAGTSSGPHAFFDAIRPSALLKNLQVTGFRTLVPDGTVR